MKEFSANIPEIPSGSAGGMFVSEIGVMHECLRSTAAPGHSSEDPRVED